jgi:hypothetical protein
MATTLKVQRFVCFKLLGFGFANHGLGRASQRACLFQKGVNGLQSQINKWMMEKGAQKAQIIGDINMIKVNMFIETLKMNPMQIRKLKPFQNSPNEMFLDVMFRNHMSLLIIKFDRVPQEEMLMEIFW